MQADACLNCKCLSSANIFTGFYFPCVCGSGPRQKFFMVRGGGGSGVIFHAYGVANSLHAPIPASLPSIQAEIMYILSLIQATCDST